MSDNLRRYRAIRDALTQWYPGQPTGTVARHLTTLAALISGIVASKSTQLPKIATHSMLKFFQDDNVGMLRMTSSARYFKEVVGPSRPH